MAGTAATFAADEARFGPDGLITAIVQDSATAQVLMVAHQNEEALRLTLETGDVHFWSRSRQELWRKGATSGNTMRLVGASLDCDGDAVLLEVSPAGPACHTGARSCFSDERPAGFAALDDLWETISARAALRPEGSYTARLIEAGVDGPARKVAEEAIEVVMAAKDHATGGPNRIPDEVADLLYHLLVLLAERDVDPSTVLDVLAERAG